MFLCMWQTPQPGQTQHSLPENYSHLSPRCSNLVSAGWGMAQPRPEGCTSTFAGVCSYLCAADHPLVWSGLCCSSRDLTITCFKGTAGLASLVCVFPSKSAKTSLWMQQWKPLSESLSLGIQQRGKRRAKPGQDPRALHMNNCKWEKDAPRDRVGGKLWQWLITPKAGRAEDYLTAQHACGIGWTPWPSEIPKDFVQSASIWHLQMKTELFAFPALNKLHFSATPGQGFCFRLILLIPSLVKVNPAIILTFNPQWKGQILWTEAKAFVCSPK